MAWPLELKSATTCPALTTKRCVLLTATGLALAARRRLPVTVYVGLAAASVVYYVAGYPDGPGWVSLFIAAYTLAAYGDGRRSLQIIMASLAGLTAVFLFVASAVVTATVH